MEPDEIVTADALVAGRIARISTVETPVKQIGRAAFDAQFPAHISQVPDPVIGSSTRCGRKYLSRSLISSPEQLPG